MDRSSGFSMQPEHNANNIEYDIKKISAGEFPSQLLEIPDPPKELWLSGTLPSPETRLLTVVGSRALTPYGKEACEVLISGLRGYPISIVSGLALGADGCAHRAALKTGLHTIAVPGSGLSKEVLYPRSHTSLAQEILEAGGALLSEHPPLYRAHPHDFPSRNRIMVGLAHAVLIIEAGERSGTILTARLAGDYNRELLCVPHQIGHRHSFGARHFIREGATLVAEPEHILEALQIPLHEQQRNALVLPSLSAQERLLLSVLVVPQTRDELLRTRVLPAQELFATLVLLEMKGLVIEKQSCWQHA